MANQGTSLFFSFSFLKQQRQSSDKATKTKQPRQDRHITRQSQSKTSMRHKTIIRQKRHDKNKTRPTKIKQHRHSNKDRKKEQKTKTMTFFFIQRRKRIVFHFPLHSLVYFPLLKMFAGIEGNHVVIRTFDTRSCAFF